MSALKARLHLSNARHRHVLNELQPQLPSPNSLAPARMTVLITGAAGFIGAAVCERLLGRGERVVGIDNLNGYYDPALKQARLDRLGELAPSPANGPG